MQIWFADYNSGWSGISRLEFVAKWCSQVSNSNAVLLFLSSKGWSLGRAGIALFRIHKYSRVCFGGWHCVTGNCQWSAGQAAKPGCLWGLMKDHSSLPAICMGRTNCCSHGKSQTLLVQQFLKDTRREGEAFSLKKEHYVSKCRNKMAATKWSNFCMMLLFPGLSRCGTFFTSCSAVKCTC